MQWGFSQIDTILSTLVLDLESEVMRGLDSIPTGGNILSLDFFHVVKPLMPILPFCQFCQFAKNSNVIQLHGAFKHEMTFLHSNVSFVTRHHFIQ